MVKRDLPAKTFCPDMALRMSAACERQRQGEYPGFSGGEEAVQRP